MTDNRFPPGWDEERVRHILAHYELQSDEEAAAEDEAAVEEGSKPTSPPPGGVGRRARPTDCTGGNDE